LMGEGGDGEEGGLSPLGEGASSSNPIEKLWRWYMSPDNNKDTNL
jgi:hypothetical protein